MSQAILYLLIEATGETLWMVFASTSIAIVFGLPLGVLLYITRPANIYPQKSLHFFLSSIINITRSIPFIILMIAVIPLTRLIVGTSIGTQAAIVPLALAAIPFIARLIESALLEVDKGLIEAAVSMGASNWHIITKVLLAESKPYLINGLTLTLVNLVGFSAMAGAVGGGGLGDLAIRYGYQRFDVTVMLVTIVIMVAIVQAIQMCGDFLAKRISHFKS